jgi:hypothetical protein
MTVPMREKAVSGSLREGFPPVISLRPTTLSRSRRARLLKGVAVGGCVGGDVRVARQPERHVVGFELTRVVPTPSPYSVIEGVRA